MGACTSCGTVLPAGARFCPSCGTPAAPGTGCPTCGSALPEGARFCPSCGTPVRVALAAEERKLVSVLFADVVGSTGLGERLDAERLRDLQDSLFAAMREEIEAEGGTVEKYAGDAVMAVFGAPVAHEDDAARAMRAAARLHSRVAKLGPAAGVDALRLRIGVNTGEVVASAIARPDTTIVTGDVVNVAARLEQLAEPGQTVVSARTARSCPTLRTRPLGEVTVRGRQAPVGALAVVGGEPMPARGLAGLSAPLVGRERELATLTMLWGRVVTERRPHLVTVYGEPGVGKSRLTREFGAWIGDARPDALVLRGRCLPYGEGITYWPLAEMVKSLAGVLDSDPPDAARSKVARLGAHLLPTERVPDPHVAVTALAHTVGLSTDDDPLHAVDPRRIRAEMRTAWRALFTALAERHPVHVVVEDVHWADPALLDLLDDVAERATGPLLIVCPARPELAASRPGWGGGRRSSSLTLEPLAAADAERLVESLLDAACLTPAVEHQILDRAEGNPFFLEEIVRQLVDEGSIVCENDRWRITGDLRRITLPDTVQGVLAARIDLLDGVTKHVLQQAAVIGREFWTGPLEALTGLDRTEAADALDALEARDLILLRPSSSLAGQREYAFKHILTRDVAYETLTRRDRAEAHRRIADWIETTAGGRLPEVAELLAHHRRAAHRWAVESGAPAEEIARLRRRSFVTLLAAASDATRRFALGNAQRLAAEALDVAADDVERAWAEEALGEAYFFDYGTGYEAFVHFCRAVDLHLSTPVPDRVAVARIASRAVEGPTRWPATMGVIPSAEEVRPYLDAGLANVGDAETEERVRLLAAVSWWPSAYGGDNATDVERKEALVAGEEAAAMAERLDLPDLAAAALDGVFGYYLRDGRFGAATEIVDRRLALVPKLSLGSEIGDVFAMAAWQRYAVGQYTEALSFALEGYERSKEESPPMSVHCLVWAAKAAFHLGELDEVLRVTAIAETSLGERVDRPPPFAAPLFAVAAVVHLVRGDDLSAAVLRDRVASCADDPTTRRTLLAAWRARAAMLAGDFEGAAHDLSHALEYFQSEGKGEIREAWCDLTLVSREWDRAAAVAEQARAEARAGGLLALPFAADRLEGAAAIARGDLAQGERLLARADRGFTELGAHWDAAWCRLLRGGAHRTRGDAFLDVIGCAPRVRDRLDPLR